MRPFTILASVLAACGLPLANVGGPASAAAAGTDESFVIGSAGVFALLDDYDCPLLGGLQYRGSPRTGWALRPGAGVLAGEGA